jgi:hypothetical protein
MREEVISRFCAAHFEEGTVELRVHVCNHLCCDACRCGEEGQQQLYGRGCVSWGVGWVDKIFREDDQSVTRCLTVDEHAQRDQGEQGDREGVERSISGAAGIEGGLVRQLFRYMVFVQRVCVPVPGHYRAQLRFCVGMQAGIHDFIVIEGLNVLANLISVVCRAIIFWILHCKVLFNSSSDRVLVPVTSATS